MASNTGRKMGRGMRREVAQRVGGRVNKVQAAREIRASMMADEGSGLVPGTFRGNRGEAMSPSEGAERFRSLSEELRKRRRMRMKTGRDMLESM